MSLERPSPEPEPEEPEEEPEPDPAQHARGNSWTAEKDASFRGELSELKLSQLKKRARVYVSDDVVDGLDDEISPKAAAIELLVSLARHALEEEEQAAALQADAARTARIAAKRKQRADEAAAEAARLAAAEKYARLKAAADKAAIVRKKKEAELRAELGGLKLSELKKRARSEAVGAAAIDELDDADDPNAAAIELLVAAAVEWWEADEIEAKEAAQGR